MTSTPSSRARIVAAAMTLFRPGAGPPPHRIASLLCVSMLSREPLAPLRAARLRGPIAPRRSRLAGIVISRASTVQFLRHFRQRRPFLPAISLEAILLR